MGDGYRVDGVGYIIQSGDAINEAVNLWSAAYAEISKAELGSGALSKAGEGARRAYETSVRGATMKSLEAAQNSLIQTREAMYQIAGVYNEAELEAMARAAKARGPLHRPEIDDARH
ncbi:hypothetical protein [Actinomadura logoneensis]|uniref:hypothetical protein n=1 Tax=Actinomadura logoneensis TaxID=2293572 RepID=UPI0011C1C154|nr:hypothetical protein [Actinomadura logoneensis]